MKTIFIFLISAFAIYPAYSANRLITVQSSPSCNEDKSLGQKLRETLVEAMRQCDGNIDLLDLKNLPPQASACRDWSIEATYSCIEYHQPVLPSYPTDPCDGTAHQPPCCHFYGGCGP